MKSSLANVTAERTCHLSRLIAKKISDPKSACVLKATNFDPFQAFAGIIVWFFSSTGKHLFATSFKRAVFGAIPSRVSNFLILNSFSFELFPTLIQTISSCSQSKKLFFSHRRKIFTPFSRRENVSESFNRRRVWIFLSLANAKYNLIQFTSLRPMNGRSLRHRTGIETWKEKQKNLFSNHTVQSFICQLPTSSQYLNYWLELFNFSSDIQDTLKLWISFFFWTRSWGFYIFSTIQQYS